MAKNNTTTITLERIIANDNNKIFCGAKWLTTYDPIYMDAVRGVCADVCNGYDNKCKQYYPYIQLQEAKRLMGEKK